MTPIQKGSLLTFVLAFGLISCAPDKMDNPSQEKSKLPEPVIQNSNFKLKVTDLKVGNDFIWSLSDSLQFEGTQGFENIEVNSLCTWREMTYSFEQKLAMKGSFKLREILPREMLSVYFVDQSADCEMKFVASNGRGDRHSFEIENLQLGAPNEVSEIQLVDQRTSEIAPSSLARKWTRAEAENLKIHGPLSNATKLQLLCNDLNLEASAPPNHMRMISDFPLFSLDQNSTYKEILMERPLQHCRVVAFNAKQEIESASSLFSIVLKETLISASNIQSSQFEWSRLKVLAEIRGTMQNIYANGNGMTVFSIDVVTNFSSLEMRFPRHLNHQSYYAVEKSNENKRIPSPQLFLVEAPVGDGVRLSYQMTAESSVRAPFPWLVKMEADSLNIEVYQTDPLNGDPKILAFTKTIEIPQLVFKSDRGERETKELFLPAMGL